MGAACPPKCLSVITVLLLCRFTFVVSDGPPNLDFSDEIDNDNFQKRLSSFVRIGRALSSFVRIGKSLPMGSLPMSDVYEETDGEDDDDFDNDVLNSALYNYDPSDFDTPAKRAHAFVRIGKSFEEPDYGLSEAKRGSAFMRMGKFPSSAFLRHNGRVQKIHPQPPPYYHRTGRIGHSFIRIGKRDTSNALRRMNELNNEMDDMNRVNEMNADNAGYGVPFGESDDAEYVRLDDDGKGADGRVDGDDGDIDVGKRQHSFVRIGRPSPLERALMSRDVQLADDLPKRLSSFVRIGKSYPEKRMSSFVRIGRNYSPVEKRQHSFVRIGKSSQPVAKRTSSFVRIGKAGDKRRTSSFVRIGKDNGLVDGIMKRLSSFVRIGKSPSDGADYPKRWTSSFVRIGKNYPEYDMADKRASSFVRIGKNGQDQYIDDIDQPEKRLHSFVRIGKADPSSEFGDIVQPIEKYDTEKSDIDNTKLDQDLNTLADSMDNGSELKDRR